MYGSQWGSCAAARRSYKAVTFYYKSRENSYQVLQVICVHQNVQWNQRFVCWNHYPQNTKLYEKKKWISLVCCHSHCYSCCALITIQTAINSWYFLVLWWYFPRNTHGNTSPHFDHFPLFPSLPSPPSPPPRLSLLFLLTLFLHPSLTPHLPCPVFLTTLYLTTLHLTPFLPLSHPPFLPPSLRLSMVISPTQWTIFAGWPLRFWPKTCLATLTSQTSTVLVLQHWSWSQGRHPLLAYRSQRCSWLTSVKIQTRLCTLCQGNFEHYRNS